MTNNLSCKEALGPPAVGGNHFTESSNFLLSGWDRAVRAIRSLQSLQFDWDGAGGRPVPQELLLSAIGFCHLFRDAKQPAPTTVYPLSDGHVMIEWRFADGIIVRFEVESPGRGEFMQSYPNGKEAQFWDYRWESSKLGLTRLGETTCGKPQPRPHKRAGFGWGREFSLAA